MLPTCCAACWPGCVTLTVPSAPMLIELTPDGMVMGGSIGSIREDLYLKNESVPHLLIQSY